MLWLSSYLLPQSLLIIPNLEMSAGVRILRFPMMIIASLFGVIGIMVGMSVIIIHILSMDSLGVPYGSPFLHHLLRI